MKDHTRYMKTCPRCQGTGRVRVSRSRLLSSESIVEMCLEDFDEDYTDICPTCHGIRRLWDPHSKPVKSYLYLNL